jgi:glycerol-3-phosphate acyltransferase PlsY
MAIFRVATLTVQLTYTPAGAALTPPEARPYKAEVLPLAVLFVLGGYLAGSIPFGVLFARARGVDLRTIGSGNIGATNVARALGRPLGIVVFLCDAAKGFAPMLAARLLLAPRMEHGAWVVAAVGVAAFLGHLFPPWLAFRGGKGVATAFGVFLALSVYPSLIAGACFVVTWAVTRISSVGSMVAATLFVPALWYFGADRAYLAAAIAMWALILFKHRSNIGRLLRGQEKKVGKPEKT